MMDDGKLIGHHYTLMACRTTDNEWAEGCKPEIVSAHVEYAYTGAANHLGQSWELFPPFVRRRRLLGGCGAAAFGGLALVAVMLR